MIEIATNKQFVSNKKKKHVNFAKNGWYRYDTRFALHVYNEGGELVRYNMWSATLIANTSQVNPNYIYMM